MDGRINELINAFKKVYEHPDERCTPDGDGNYIGIKHTYDLDEINLSKIDGFEGCTYEEIESLINILKKETFTWVKKTDLE
ncbi:MAG: hypothetical protein K6F15_10170 [Treponema sp.]|nr:hypothetical protein [Treponema sp.]